MGKSNRHRATVLEVYENGLRAAVQFNTPQRKGRVECVVRRGDTPDFYVGQTGMVDYVRCLNGFEWTFIPGVDYSEKSQAAIAYANAEMVARSKESKP